MTLEIRELRVSIGGAYDFGEDPSIENIAREDIEPVAPAAEAEGVAVAGVETARPALCAVDPQLADSGLVRVDREIDIARRHGELSGSLNGPVPVARPENAAGCAHHCPIGAGRSVLEDHLRRCRTRVVGTETDHERVTVRRIGGEDRIAGEVGAGAAEIEGRQTVDAIEAEFGLIGAGGLADHVVADARLPFLGRVGVARFCLCVVGIDAVSRRPIRGHLVGQRWEREKLALRATCYDYAGKSHMLKSVKAERSASMSV